MDALQWIAYNGCTIMDALCWVHYNGCTIKFLTVPSGVVFYLFPVTVPEKTLPHRTLIFTILGHFQSEPGHVPRCINRSVWHLRRPTNISIYTLYPCTYYGMTTIGNGLYYFEI